jgi:hypothetical protein
MTETNFRETVLLLRDAPVRLGELALRDQTLQGRIQSWVIGAGVFIAVLLSAAAYF